MPTYVYEVITGDDEPGQMFEVEQRMSDEPLKKHPTTGQPVRRVIQPPNLPSRYTSMHEKSKMSNKNLDRLGFTKYEKTSDGQYTRTAGKDGPKTLEP
jgi:hypothetical protein